jgi:hypothetical protein
VAIGFAFGCWGTVFAQEYYEPQPFAADLAAAADQHGVRFRNALVEAEAGGEFS